MCVKVRVRKQTVAPQNPVTARRRRWLQDEIGLTDAFKEVRGPFVGYFFKRVRARLPHDAIKISERGFARLGRDRERVAVD